MTCHWCSALARHRVTGSNGTWLVCDQHLDRARTLATLPRTIELIELGLLDPGQSA